MRLARCFSTVFTLRKSASAISRLRRPSAISLSTCFSRAVRVSDSERTARLPPPFSRYPVTMRSATAGLMYVLPLSTVRMAASSSLREASFST